MIWRGIQGKVAGVGGAGCRGALPAGFEPATYGLEIRCSIQLSYGRIKFDQIGSVPGPRTLLAEKLSA